MTGHHREICNGENEKLLQITTGATSTPAMPHAAKEEAAAYFPGDTEAQGEKNFFPLITKVMHIDYNKILESM